MVLEVIEQGYNDGVLVSSVFLLGRGMRRSGEDFWNVVGGLPMHTFMLPLFWSMHSGVCPLLC